MTHKEKLIAYLEEEIRLLKDNEPFIDNRYRNFPLTRIQLGDIQTQLADLNEKVNALSEKKSCCVLSEDDNTLKFLSGKNNNLQRDKQELSDWLANDVAKLTIVDPYFFYFDKPNNTFVSLDEYAIYIANLIPNSVIELDVFHKKNKLKNNVVSKFKTTLENKNPSININRIETDEIHDRIIINHDNSSAKLVGGSLNGYGVRLSFVLNLPTPDLDDFLQELSRIKSNSINATI